MGTIGALGTPAELLPGLLDYLNTILNSDWDSLTGPDATAMLPLIEQTKRLFFAIETRTIDVIDKHSSWEQDGSRSVEDHVKRLTGTSHRSAKQAVTQARAFTDDFPLTRQALDNGLISSEHSAIIVREGRRSRTLRSILADPTRGEARLLEMAQDMGVDKFVRHAKSWAIQHDPEGADADWREDLTKETVTLARAGNGWKLTGYLSEESAQILARALAAAQGRKAADSTATPAERDAQAMTTIASLLLDMGVFNRGARIRPDLSVNVPHDTFQKLIDASELATNMVPASRHSGAGAGAGDRDVIGTGLDYTHLQGSEPATFEDGEPIPPALLARIACGSTFRRLIFGPDSEILDVGREQRFFTQGQARAVYQRDKTCRYPGCDMPPKYIEIHHGLEWFKHQGPTDIALAVLICKPHHTWIHAQGITVTRENGETKFYTRNGDLIAAPAPPWKPGPINDAPRLRHPPHRVSRANRATDAKRNSRQQSSRRPRTAEPPQSPLTRESQQREQDARGIRPAVRFTSRRRVARMDIHPSYSAGPMQAWIAVMDLRLHAPRSVVPILTRQGSTTTFFTVTPGRRHRCHAL